MKLILLMVTLILFVGCTPPEIIYINNTINQTVIQEVEVIKEIEVIKEVEIIKECPPSQTEKLTLCHIRLDEINTILYACLMNNNTIYSDNLTEELKQCEINELNYEKRLRNASAWG